MNLNDVIFNVGNTPYISKSNGSFIYNLIINEKLTNILELGIAHGTATCYMAAALQEMGCGSVTSVDLLETRNAFKPSVEELLKKTGLSNIVTVKRMQTGYTWFLHDEIVRNTEQNLCNQIYDLCIIDGPKNWTIDGAAFFLVDKLLKKNGWIVFDDYNWRYADADLTRTSTDGITHRSLSTEEKDTPQIRDVFELLVKQHPNYGNFMVLNDEWAIAQKTMPNSPIEDMDIKNSSLKLDEINSLYQKSEGYHITYAISQLVAEGIKEVIVYGAGSEILIMLDKLHVKDITVVAIVDKDKRKIGKYIQEVPIISMNEATKCNCNNYILNSTSYQDEMRNTILDAYNTDCNLLNIMPRYNDL